jgi:hypothetical protein
VHDRRIDGETLIFGNHGALFMNAMTWWDHATGSVWSQPWGRALQGEYKGIELFLLPSQVTTWSNWVAAHPNTLVMINDVEHVSPSVRQGFTGNFVLGLLLDGNAKAYAYDDILSAGVVNDHLGNTPIVVWADEEVINAFVRRVENQTLTITIIDGLIQDMETSSSWDLARGLALDGPLSGQALQPIPGSTAYDWAWLDFYPQSEFFTP